MTLWAGELLAARFVADRTAQVVSACMEEGLRRRTGQWLSGSDYTTCCALYLLGRRLGLWSDSEQLGLEHGLCHHCGKVYKPGRKLHSSFACPACSRSKVRPDDPGGTALPTFRSDGSQQGWRFQLTLRECTSCGLPFMPTRADHVKCKVNCRVDSVRGVPPDPVDVAFPNWYAEAERRLLETQQGIFLEVYTALRRSGALSPAAIFGSSGDARQEELIQAILYAVWRETPEMWDRILEESGRSAQQVAVEVPTSAAHVFGISFADVELLMLGELRSAPELGPPTPEIEENLRLAAKVSEHIASSGARTKPIADPQDARQGLDGLHPAELVRRLSA